jgi:hypothetical protein
MNGLMEVPMREIGWITKSLEKAAILGTTEEFIKVSVSWKLKIRKLEGKQHAWERKLRMEGWAEV